MGRVKNLLDGIRKRGEDEDYELYIATDRPSDFLGYSNKLLLKLDEEDIEYLKSKYNKKLAQELEEEINKLRDEYKIEE